MPKYPNPKNQNDWRAGSPDTNFDAYQAPTTGNQAQHSYEMPRFDVPTGAEFWKPTAMGTQMASEALIDAERGQGLAQERLKQGLGSAAMQQAALARGGGPMAQRAAMMAGAQQASQGVGQAAMLQQQEIAAARQGLTGALQHQAGMGMGLAQLRAMQEQAKAKYQLQEKKIDLEEDEADRRFGFGIANTVIGAVGAMGMSDPKLKGSYSPGDAKVSAGGSGSPLSQPVTVDEADASLDNPFDTVAAPMAAPAATAAPMAPPVRDDALGIRAVADPSLEVLEESHEASRGAVGRALQGLASVSKEDAVDVNKRTRTSDEDQYDASLMKGAMGAISAIDKKVSVRTAGAQARKRKPNLRLKEGDYTAVRRRDVPRPSLIRHAPITEATRIAHERMRADEDEREMRALEVDAKRRGVPADYSTASFGSRLPYASLAEQAAYVNELNRDLAATIEANKKGKYRRREGVARGRPDVAGLTLTAEQRKEGLTEDDFSYVDHERGFAYLKPGVTESKLRGTSSDMRGKQGLRADRTMDDQDTYHFEYKPENQRSLALPAGHRVGLMADRLEETPLGAAAVKETEDGKVIDRDNYLFGVVTPGLQRLHERLEALEKKKGKK